MVESKRMTFIEEDASEIPWFRFQCEDCGASRDQRFRRIRDNMDLNKSWISCAACHGQAFIIPNSIENPVIGECILNWWVDEDGNEVGHRAPRDFMQPQSELRPAGWLRKLAWKVQEVLSFLAGEG